MIIDGNDVDASRLPAYDLVVVGTGIAGQTLVQELLPAGFRIAVIESGSHQPTASVDALKHVRTPHYKIADDSRERYLGGTANTWGRGCVKLGQIDFEARPWVADSGWPFPRAELEPYYQSACRLLGIVDADGIQTPEGAYPLDGDGLTTHFLLYTKRLVGFDSDLLAEMRDGDRIDLLLNSNVVAIEPNEQEDRIERLRIKTLRGASFAVEGGSFVLACGGIENARLLLMSPTADGRGVGNRHDTVGCYFMEHPKGVVGFIRPADRHVDPWPYIVCTIGGQSLQGGLSLTEDVQRREQVLNSHARFIVERKWERNAGVRALAALVRGTSVPPDASADEDDFPADERTKVKLVASLIANLPQVVLFGSYKLLRRKRPIQRIWLKNLAEMAPRRENRVRLDRETDELGCPRAVVDYAPSELDKRTIALLHRVVADRVTQSGYGTFESPLLESVDNWNVTRDSAHHMGSTRMGSDPKTSVTNSDGRIHGIENLYIIGSSLFPATGYANPTMTIVALTIRLAEHLRDQLATNDRLRPER